MYRFGMPLPMWTKSMLKVFVGRDTDVRSGISRHRDGVEMWSCWDHNAPNALRISLTE